MTKTSVLILQLFLVFLIVSLLDARSLKLLDGWTGIITSSGLKFSATVPGNIYTDLENAKVIPETIKGANDVKNRWVANKTISYITHFKVNDTFSKASKVALVFHGLDTFATIFINNDLVGTSENMFVKYVFDVKKNLKNQLNQLEVRFASPLKISKELYLRQKEDYEVVPTCTPKEYNGECHINHIRKMQASYGWDWGIAVPTSGIWKDVELISITKAYVTDITADVIKKESHWEVVVGVFFDTLSYEKNTPFNVDIQIALKVDSGHITINTKDVLIEVKKKYGNTSVVLQVPEKSVKLWWPNGYGEQNLYKLTTKIKIHDYETVNRKQIGFRTVELVQEPLDEGLTFFFRVNGLSIFAKGSNYIPASIFPHLSTKKDTVLHLLTSVKEANMNMLRVWGGGVYESDTFYSLADKLGILIWQDFMFACNLYPSAEWFITSVKNEVVQNVRRLKHHPSIALWAGNNENGLALYSAWYGVGTNSVYEEDYIKLYVKLIKHEVEKLDTTRPFVVSSPGNGLYDDQNGYFKFPPYSRLYGDDHHYNYFGDGWNSDSYPRVRFSSEYGFQSWPSIKTLESAAEADTDLKLDSLFLKHRQHLLNGDHHMKNLIGRNLIIPESNNSRRDLEDYVYLSQINQAVSIKTETESYRQCKSSLNSVGEGLTAGALYWQLNDVWAAPTWSSIDFCGRWKMLHYYAKNFFAPVIVSTRLTHARELEIYVISDLHYALKNFFITINIYKWNSMVPISVQNITEVAVKADESKLIKRLWLDDYLRQVGCGSLASAKENCLVELLLKNYTDNQLLSVNYVYPMPLKSISLPSAKITMTVNPKPLPGKLANYLDYEIELTSNEIALFVWLEMVSISGRFSENGFHMLQGKKTVILHAMEAVTIKEIINNVSIKTLSDVHNSHEADDRE